MAPINGVPSTPTAIIPMPAIALSVRAPPFGHCSDVMPNMVGQISTCLAAAGLNIAELLNKSRGGLAYTLIDAEGGISAELLAKLRAIDGVLAARVVQGQPGRG